ncbi:C40 family peptidase [Corynebacterium incognita]|uniref:C40 family peptidase n=1 Tax=Corynebacterium incognita TaxID=2754725 RepID=A0A7G7CPR5_9CORY|nr:NlpC/P60 family protein [Corynebacterium incognita]QNE89581.1 C40 family peptidase [Corynebacterium incognita]
MTTSISRTRKRSKLVRRRNFLATVACTVTVSTATSVTPAMAQEQSVVEKFNNALSSTGDVGDLAAILASLNAEIATLESEMGRYQQQVNKALVDFHNARTKAQQARLGASTAKKKLGTANTNLEDAQALLNGLSSSQYRRAAGSQPVTQLAGGDASADALDRQSYLRQETAKRNDVIDNLERVRTDKANQESTLRKVKQLAEDREKKASDVKSEAQSVLADSAAEHAELSTQHDELTRLQEKAQRKLDVKRGGNSHAATTAAAAPEATPAAQPAATAAAAETTVTTAAPAPSSAAEESTVESTVPLSESAVETSTTEQTPTPTEQAPEETVSEPQRPTRPARPAQTEAASTFATDVQAFTDALNEAATIISGSQPELTLETVEESESSTQLPALQLSGDATDAAATGDESVDSLLNELDTNDSVSSQASQALPDSSREQKIEAVIARAESQIGAPYAWGGGTASGPSQGIRDGGTADAHGDYNKVGFDCSGLTLYAFSAAGLSLPHYTGYQYTMGEQIDPANMQRGDLIFYGPQGNHHVAIYLGNGEMLEAPQSGQTVTKTPVRWSGMSPHAVRLL